MLTLIAALLPQTLLPQIQAPPRFPDFPDQDALRYDLQLEVDPAKQRLEGTVRYTIRAEQPLTRVRFHARRSAEFAVTFHPAGAGPELPAHWQKDTVQIELPEPAAKDAVIQLTAKLSGNPPDGFYFKSNRYGRKLAFTDHYSIRARGWLPCEDHPGDRAKWTVRLVYPLGNEAVAYGTQLEDEGPRPRPGFTAARFVSDTEIPPYMFALVVGPFARVAESGDRRITPHLVYAEDVAKAKRVLVHHGQWIGLMESTFGAYSYGKYTTVQCPTRWGGFEAPGNVQLSERLYDGDGTGTLAHELVHMWFGDAVGYSRWREVWLSEGFASYFGPWLHARSGGPTLQESMLRMRDRWRRSFEGRTKTVRDDRFPHPDQALNSNTYPKGAWVLHMLRGELGDEVFFAALQQYYGRYSGRSCVTSDFIAVVEEVAKKDLGWFFDQWLDRVDCPHLEVTSNGDKTVIRQTQKGPPYRFWVRLGWFGAATTQRVRVEGPATAVDTPPGAGAPILDPEVELLFREQRRRTVGAYYHPGPQKPDEIRRMIEGDPGGGKAFSHTLAPVVRFEDGEPREVWQEYLAATEEFGRGHLSCLLDLHVLASPQWLETDRLFDLLMRINRSPLMRYVAGWYVCDEPFGRSHPGRDSPVDVGPIRDLVAVVRRVEQQLRRKQVVVADYASVSPLLKKGGDPVNGGFDAFTGDRAEREVFLWRGKWVQQVPGEGREPLVRGYGFFGEDVTMINWWNDAAALRTWQQRIAGDVPLHRVQLVLGYDHGPDTPAANQAWLQRTAEIVRAGDALGVGGYWFWAWQGIRAQGRSYKGLSSFWETRDGTPRYAGLVEGVR